MYKCPYCGYQTFTEENLNHPCKRNIFIRRIHEIANPAIRPTDTTQLISNP